MRNKYYLVVYMLIIGALESVLAQSEIDWENGKYLLNNGGFELGSPADFGSISGWNVNGNSGSLPVGFTSTQLVSGPIYLPAEGKRMALFSAGTNDFSGSISQSFASISGNTYHLKFKMGIVTESSGRSQALHVSIKNEDGASIISHIEKIVSQVHGTTWIDVNMSFIAAGKMTNITFSDFSNNLSLRQSYNSDLLLDDVLIGVQEKNISVTKFDQWMISHKAVGGMSEDFDMDSLSNGVEYVLGTNPNEKTASNYFPKSRTSLVDPDGDGKKSRYLVFSYRKSKALDGDTNTKFFVQWKNSSSKSWKNTATAKGVIVKTINNRYRGVDYVNVYIPRSISNNSKISARLRVISKQ